MCHGANRRRPAARKIKRRSARSDPGIHSARHGPLDWLIVLAYFAVLLGVGWWAIRSGRDTADDYFLAGRNLGWCVIGAHFASNIGSEHVVGLAGSGAKDGVAMAHYELHAWCLLVLAWVFVPFYARSMVFTMPEFLERRFSVGSRYMLSVVSLVTFHRFPRSRWAFSPAESCFPRSCPRWRIELGDGLVIDSFWIGSVAVIVLTGLYTMLGGMRAVAYNDAVQTVVLITGSAVLTGYGLFKIGRMATNSANCVAPICSTFGSRCFRWAWKALGPR